MSIIACPECGNQVSSEANECPHCGFPVAERVREGTCPACGAATPPGARACPQCGHPLDAEAGAESPPPSGGEGSKPAVARVAAIGGAAALVVAAAVVAVLMLGAGEPDSPKEVWEKVQRKMAEGDYEGVFEHFSAKMQAGFETEAKRILERMREGRGSWEALERDAGASREEILEMEWKELWALLMEAESKGRPSPPAAWTLLEETVEGDRAEIRFDVGGQEETMHLVREEGRWKIGVPEKRRIGTNESSAIATLKAISTGEDCFRSSCSVDRNANGVGEYGFLDELGGTAACRGNGLKYDESPFIPSLLGEMTPGGVSTKSGYCFIVYLPTGEGSATAVRKDRVDAALAEGAYIVYAWPETQGRSGVRMFMIDAQGQPYHFLGESPHSGPHDPPAWDEALSGGDWSSGIDESEWGPTA